MVWIDKKDKKKQIITSAKQFNIPNEFAWDEFTEESCPISIKEFANYDGIPIEIIGRGFGAIKNYLNAFGTNCFISFTGLK
jgi:hypothetical protein